MLLDTTVLIDTLRGRPGIVARLQGHGGPFLASVISVDELLFGMRAGEERSTHGLIEGLELVDLGLQQVRLASTWRREFAARGVTLKQPDCLVAGCAVTTGLPLATANVEDFPMPDLHLEHWPSE